MYSRMKYLTHDNYNRPFLVELSSNQAIITNNISGKEIARYPVLQSWIGHSSGRSKSSGHKAAQTKQFDGNSVLIRISPRKYVYIGERVLEFEQSEKVKEYLSPVGNNDVPYPVIITDNHIIFMLDMKEVPKEVFLRKDDWESVYGDYYVLEPHLKSIRKVPHKQIHKRVM